jgi:hypothetical protein
MPKNAKMMYGGYTQAFFSQTLCAFTAMCLNKENKRVKVLAQFIRLKI